MNGRSADDELIEQVESSVRASKACGCSEVTDHIFEFIDSQMPKDQEARLRQHIESCPHCTEIAEAETHVREIVKRSCAESAPASLRVKITSFLSVYRAATR
ncbi:mycothiol system anti-sigma-R factor [Arcanobacterium haemolyticum]|nr:mycothiol system anti-sigma-R factor [Arcanobacterium haemolyticum]